LGNNEENREEADISRITEIGVAKCQILPTFLRPRNLADFPEFEYPSLLRTLKIYNKRLYQKDFRSLLTGTRNLHNLTLSSRTYPTFLDFSNVQPLELPNLRRLTLGKFDEENYLADLWGQVLNIPRKATKCMSGFGELLRIFALSSLPRLDKFKLCASALYMREIDLITNRLVHFLVQHAASLHNLQISFLDVDEYQHMARVDNERLTCVHAQTQKLLSQLEQLQLGIYVVKLFSCEEPGKWSHFINTIEQVAEKVTSVNLRDTAYPFYPETPYYAHFIENSKETLTYLTLTVSNLNCELLAQCTSLQELELFGSTKMAEAYETENYQGVPAASEVVHLALLPKSIEGVMIVDLFVTSTEIASISFANFPLLKKLKMIGVGEKEDLGMTLKDLSTLVGRSSGDAEKSFYLEIEHGMNRRSVLDQPQPTLPNDTQDVLVDSSLHCGSQMLTKLAFQRAFRKKREAARVLPVQHKFQFQQNWEEGGDDQAEN